MHAGVYRKVRPRRAAAGGEGNDVWCSITWRGGDGEYGCGCVEDERKKEGQVVWLLVSGTMCWEAARRPRLGFWVRALTAAQDSKSLAVWTSFFAVGRKRHKWTLSDTS